MRGKRLKALRREFREALGRSPVKGGEQIPRPDSSGLMTIMKAKTDELRGMKKAYRRTRQSG